jgi:hypothetical protein
MAILSVPSDILVSYLVDQDLVTRPAGSGGTNAAWPMTIGNMPLDGDQWMTSMDTDPFLELKLMDTGETVTKPTCQILCRDRNYNTAFYQLREVTYNLSALKNVSVTTSIGEIVLFNACTITMQPTFLRQEEKNRRQIFVANVRLSITKGGAT